MSILLKGFSLVLKTLTVLSDQKNRPTQCEWRVSFFSNYQRANGKVKDRHQRWCLLGTAECQH